MRASAAINGAVERALALPALGNPGLPEHTMAEWDSNWADWDNSGGHNDWEDWNPTPPGG